MGGGVGSRWTAIKRREFGCVPPSLPSFPPSSIPMRPVSLTLVFLAALSSSYAGFTETGQSCNPANNRLQIGTYQFWSECVTTNFCSDKGICEPRSCRNDDFPFGYAQDSDSIPPKCTRGQFCPDEGSGCQDLLSVGSPCQMDRDGSPPIQSHFTCCLTHRSPSR